ncbi:MAG: DUF1573 domain-containing protein [Gemmatimonadaceae bacterium]|nr:DUF1573 domain-containing protein [Chitinophagaceae bacterium]
MRLVLFLAVAISAAACNNQADANANVKTAPTQTGLVNSSPDSANFTSIQWIEQTRDYGKMNEGQKLEVKFRFKNTGNKPLVIESVRASCGCTAAEPPKEPIAPGGEGEIVGSFDSNGKTGLQHKSIYVLTNTKGVQNHELVFNVDVIKKQ